MQTFKHLATHSPLKARHVAKPNNIQISACLDKPSRSQIEYVSHSSSISNSDRQSGAVFCYKKHCVFSNTPSCDVSWFRASTIQNCQKYAPNRTANKQPHIQPYSPYRLTSRYCKQEHSKCALRPISAIKTIYFWSFHLCYLCSFPHFAIRQT